jgi:hypothetical protein
MSKGKKKMAAELLSEAVDVLLTDGWTQGSFGADNSPHCAGGAIMKASRSKYSHDVEDTAMNALENEIERTVGRHESIVAWNDKSGQTKENVINTILNASSRVAVPWYQRLFN